MVAGIIDDILGGDAIILRHREQAVGLDPLPVQAVHRQDVQLQVDGQIIGAVFEGVIVAEEDGGGFEVEFFSDAKKRIAFLNFVFDHIDAWPSRDDGMRIGFACNAIPLHGDFRRELHLGDCGEAGRFTDSRFCAGSPAEVGLAVQCLH